MGTINYKSNDYINLGYDLSNQNFYCRMVEFYDDDSSRDDLEGEINATYELIEDLIESYDLEFFKINIKNGYYEGFYIDINFDYSYFYNYIEKQDAQKEITKIKKLLYDIIDYGNIVNCHNGWCTGYDTIEDTKAAIKEAIKKMRYVVNTTDTARKHFKNWWI